MVIGFGVQRTESMPWNAVLYLCADKTYVSPPCVDAYGFEKFGFGNEEELYNSMILNIEVENGKYYSNKLCRDKMPFNIKHPTAGGFSGDSRPAILYYLLGFSEPRWNIDGSWNW